MITSLNEGDTLLLLTINVKMKAKKFVNAGTKGSHIRNIIKFSGSTVKIASQVKRSRIFHIN